MNNFIKLARNFLLFHELVQFLGFLVLFEVIPDGLDELIKISCHRVLQIQGMELALAECILKRFVMSEDHRTTELLGPLDLHLLFNTEYDFLRVIKHWVILYIFWCAISLANLFPDLFFSIMYENSRTWFALAHF